MTAARHHKALRAPVALLAGAIFGIGLAQWQMVDRLKVLGFLDVTGAWDASIVFVLGGAVTLAAIGFRFVLRRRSPALHERFHLPDAKTIDGRLIAGAAIFGVGWGIAGYCPGPAIASLGFATRRRGSSCLPC